MAGRVVAVHVRAGERVGEGGIVEIADVTPMYAIAEVYETDVGKVRPGQPATVSARALPGGELRGRVTRVGTKVGRKDVLDTDPVADADARVVECEIELEDAVATLIAVLAPGRAWLWVAVIGIGIFAGPNQSASRSLMGRFVPDDKENEFFGFFAFSGKLTAFIGPLMLGILTQAFDSQRAGIAIVLVLFVIGLILLARVDEKEGIELAGR